MSATIGMLPSAIQTQQTQRLTPAPNTSNAKSAEQTNSSEDTVSISQEGRNLLKASKTTSATSSEESQESSAEKTAEASKGQTGTSASVLTQNTTKLSATVQEEKGRIHSLTAKMEAAKNQPGSVEDVNKYEAQLSDLNTSLAKDKAKLYSA